MRFLRFLHARPQTGEPDGDLKQSYADYAQAIAHANAMLQRHGPQSEAFAKADIAGMRLFHRVKKMQGLKMPGKARAT